MTPTSHFSRRMADPAVQAWVELRFAPSPITLADIALALRERAIDDLRGTAGRITQWLQAGLLTVSGRPAAYAMVADAKRMADPPLLDASRRIPRHWTQRRTTRQRLWTAMRVLKSFDLVTLRLAADASERGARDFVRVMTQAGYLQPAATGSATGHPRWRQGERGWGPIAPTITYHSSLTRSWLAVTDRNDGSVFEVPLKARIALPPLARGEG